MKVRLLKDVVQGGSLKVAMRSTGAVPFVRGAVVDVSEATGEKWVKDGLCEPVEEENSEPAAGTEQRAERDSPPPATGTPTSGSRHRR